MATSVIAFSPDSKRIAYMGEKSGKQTMVVDGIKGREYLGFVRGSQVVFDSNTSLHGLAYREDENFQMEHIRVEAAIVQE